MAKQKRVAAIHDISCFGRCSLTVALPILSSAGIETSVVPTAILSTHTGGFTGYTFRDLTGDIRPIANHWKSLGLEFDSIYTGYLGSFEQLDIISEFFDEFGTGNNLIMVDPVMADNGRLYANFSPDFPKGMLKLCQKADIIVPNLTEAAFLLDKPYCQGPYTKEYIDSLLFDLAETGTGKIVLTGVCFDTKNLGAASFDTKTGKISYSFSEKIEGYYHGTGDVFASALLAALLNGFSLDESTQIAVDFTVECIRRTKSEGTDERFGVNFECTIPSLIRKLSLV